MIIIDECHHVSAVSFEKVLTSAPAEYVYGLTATPQRKDGHHPIIFMQCGQIRFRDDAKVQAANKQLDHYIIPRFTRMILHFQTTLHLLQSAGRLHWFLESKHEVRIYNYIDISTFQYSKRCIIAGS